jgi:hypothetical protein
MSNSPESVVREFHAAWQDFRTDLDQIVSFFR